MKNPFQRSYSPEEMVIFDFLSRTKLFDKLSHDEMAYFLPYLYLRKYKNNEVIFFRKDPGQAIYIIKEGAVSLMMDMADTFEGINHLAEGCCLGSNALLKDTYRAYNAVVTSPKAKLYVIPHVNIMDIFNSQLKIKSKMLESLAELYNEYTLELTHSYQSSKGFFSLDHVPVNF